MNCVAPTLTNTPLASGILRNDEAVKRSNERHPTKRINNAEDVAKAALFLLGDHNMTGQILHVDGGLSSLKFNYEVYFLCAIIRINNDRFLDTSQITKQLICIFFGLEEI